MLREAALVAALGSIGGLVLGYAAIRITSSRDLALPSSDVATLLITPLALGAVILLTNWVPARRAGRVERMDVLRPTLGWREPTSRGLNDAGPEATSWTRATWAFLTMCSWPGGTASAQAAIAF